MERESEPTQELEFRSCGAGCFLAPVDWSRGQSTITLHAESESLAGGTAAVAVTGPPRPAAARVKAVVAAMRKVPQAGI